MAGDPNTNPIEEGVTPPGAGWGVNAGQPMTDPIPPELSSGVSAEAVTAMRTTSDEMTVRLDILAADRTNLHAQVEVMNSGMALLDSFVTNILPSLIKLVPTGSTVSNSGGAISTLLSKAPGWIDNASRLAALLGSLPKLI